MVSKKSKSIADQLRSLTSAFEFQENNTIINKIVLKAYFAARQGKRHILFKGDKDDIRYLQSSKIFITEGKETTLISSLRELGFTVYIDDVLSAPWWDCRQRRYLVIGW